MARRRHGRERRDRRGTASDRGTVFDPSDFSAEDLAMNRLERAITGSAHGARSGTMPGPRIYNLFPLLVGRVSAWRRELPRIAELGFDWVYVNPFHEAGFSGSLYAIKDPFRLDQRFRDKGALKDDAQIKGFTNEAARLGLKVMADLVINHTSKDALLAESRPEVYVRDEAGALVSPYAIDPVDPTIKTEWGDLAELDYSRDDAREFLIGYWDEYVAYMQKLGVRGFRCD